MECTEVEHVEVQSTTEPLLVGHELQQNEFGGIREVEERVLCAECQEWKRACVKSPIMYELDVQFLGMQQRLDPDELDKSNQSEHNPKEEEIARKDEGSYFLHDPEGGKSACFPAAADAECLV